MRTASRLGCGHFPAPVLKVSPPGSSSSNSNSIPIGQIFKAIRKHPATNAISFSPLGLTPAGISGSNLRGLPRGSRPVLELKAAAKDAVRDDGGSQSREESGNGGKVGAEAGSVLGAVALVTGSTIGAGMLALPAVTAGGGFLPSSGVMTIVWSVLTLQALLIAEVNLAVTKDRRLRRENMDTVVSLRQMAADTLGPWGGRLTSTVYLFLTYTLIVAYVAKGGEMMHMLSMDSVPPAAGGILFSAILGSFLLSSKTKTVDMLNRCLTACLVVLLGLLVVGGAQGAVWESLIQQHDWDQAWAALPVIVVSMTYHDLIPVLCEYLGRDKSKVRTALVVGGMIPVAMYLAWDAVALALVPGAAEVAQAGGVIDPLRVLIETQGASAGTAIELFSLLAILTSFLGTVLGFSEYLLADVKEWQQRLMGSTLLKDRRDGDTEDGDMYCRMLAMFLALGPPSAAAFVNPDVFLTATQMAGAYGSTLLYGLLPPLMAWCVRQNSEANQKPKKPMVPGGRPVLFSLASSAVVFELGKFATDSSGFINELNSVGSQVQTAAGVVVTELASMEGVTGLLGRHL